MSGRISVFFGTSSGVVDCSWRRVLFRKGGGFSFWWSRLVFLAKHYVPLPPKNFNSRFLVPKKDFRHVTVGFAHFIVAEIRSSVCWKAREFSFCMLDITHLEFNFVSLQNCQNVGYK